MTCALLLPTLAYGMSEHHLGFPGTATLSPSTYAAVIHDLVRSLALSGFTHILLLNGHGGNIMPAKWGLANGDAAVKALASAAAAAVTAVTADPSAAADAAAPPAADPQAVTVATSGATDPTPASAAEAQDIAETPQPQVLLYSWYTGSEVSGLARGLFGASLGQHATPDEVAITQYVFPDAIKRAPLPPEAIAVGVVVAFTQYVFLDAIKRAPLPPEAIAVRVVVAFTQYVFLDAIKRAPLPPEAIAVAATISGRTKRVPHPSGVAGTIGSRTKRVPHPSGSPFLSHMCAQDFKLRFPDGRMGSDPSLATPDLGKSLYEVAVHDATTLITSWVADTLPANGGGAAGGIPPGAAAGAGGSGSATGAASAQHVALKR
ncbi:creatinine amidohydrolase-domain-containing protein [Tribonema minus]|uniref:Creatinine amidohydrolase-domain-containing protein n=1 Tax=Tribonema minus TaxID=303371 RepID=A0A835YV77_9STRA|nr:creatinine amidohydrolase-domain-containing protein [Tribonema minus]